MNLLQAAANRKLQWFKQVKESYGSMEVSALSQVEEINERGIYRTGNLEPTADDKSVVCMPVCLMSIFLS